MRILQVYHTMNLGGVGTYLLGLCTELQQRGHTILIAAPQGEFTTTLERSGIPCVNVDVRDIRILQAAKELAAMANDAQVDLICAHDYSAGAPAYLAAKKTGKPYLLTIHARRPIWQGLVVFYWSKKVVVLSPSLRNDLVTKYRLAPGRIIESFIGIDTERHSPGPPSTSLRSELGLHPDSRVILHVSRFSRTKSHIAIALANAVQQIVQACPGVVVLLVGSGEDESKIESATKRANEQAGRNVVRLLGQRTDIPDLMRIADVVVGTGIVVKEAMASGRPVVAAGKYGFIGAITPETFQSASESNFGDHSGDKTTSVDALCNAIIPLLCDPVLCERFGSWGSALMADHFSMKKMVDHIENVYTNIVSTYER